MLEELVAQPHCTHVLVKVAIKYVYIILVPNSITVKDLCSYHFIQKNTLIGCHNNQVFISRVGNESIEDNLKSMPLSNYFYQKNKSI